MISYLVDNGIVFINNGDYEVFMCFYFLNIIDDFVVGIVISGNDNDWYIFVDECNWFVFYFSCWIVFGVDVRNFFEF